MRNHPLVDEPLAVNYRSGRLLGKIRETAALVRAQGYEVFLSLDRKLLTALAARSDFFFTPDTGAVHVAGNSGVGKLVCLFACTEPAGVPALEYFMP